MAVEALAGVIDIRSGPTLLPLLLSKTIPFVLKGIPRNDRPSNSGQTRHQRGGYSVAKTAVIRALSKRESHKDSLKTTKGQG